MGYTKKFKLKYSLHDEVFCRWDDKAILTAEITPLLCGLRVENILIDKKVVNDDILILSQIIFALKNEINLILENRA